MNINNRFKKPSHWVACLLLLFFASNALAANCFNPQGAPQTANFGTVTTTASLPIGAQIAVVRSSPPMAGNSTGVIFNTGANVYQCNTQQSGNITLFTSPSAAGPKVYNTNIPGIGIRIYTVNPATGPNPTITIGFPWGPFILTNTVGAGPTMNPDLYQVELIKTADPISSGTFSSGIVATRTDSMGTQLSSLVITGTIVAPVPTCSLSTSSATFNMGTLVTSSFNGGVGHEYGWVPNQSLISGGCNATTVSMTFAGTAAAAPYTNAFANNGTATGVAMELWQANGGSQAIPNGGAINFAPQGAGGPYTFSARYIQTAPTVTAGSVNATVTVTVNYQ